MKASRPRVVCFHLFAFVLVKTEVVSANSANFDGRVPSSLRSGEIIQDSVHSEFIAYLKVLVEWEVLKEINLKQFLKALADGRLANPLGFEQGLVTSLQMIHWDELENYIRALDHLDSERWERIRKKLTRWATRELFTLEAQSLHKKSLNVATADVFLPMKFNPVERGSFYIKQMDSVPGGEVLTELTHSYEMTATPVTQHQWVSLMDGNPSAFSVGKDHGNFMTPSGQRVVVQPDHPVERLTWWSGLVFANRLSEKMGYIPAYDLSQIKFTGQADLGTLKRVSGQLKINGLRGSIYATQGFRYPTEAEFEFVARNRGQLKEAFPFGEKQEVVDQYVWHRLNSSNQTHPTAELRPFVVNGFEFFDLMGNVGIYTQNGFGDKIHGGKDPVYPIDDWWQEPDLNFRGHSVAKKIVVRGGYYGFWPNDFITMPDRNTYSLKDQSQGIGIRLVRTLEHSSEEIDFFQAHD